MKSLLGASILSFFLLQTACKKNEDAPNNSNTDGVYIAGSIDANMVLWKDGSPTYLTNLPSPSTTHYAEAQKVLVYNDDVYVLGYERGPLINGFKTIVFKNGTPLFTSESASYGNSMDIYNGDIYVCNDLGGVWKNGVLTYLPKDTFNAIRSYRIKVYNGDVYVCGAVVFGYGILSYDRERPVYWKNGVLFVLPIPLQFPESGIRNEARDIFFDNGDVHITGGKRPSNESAFYWKNGVLQLLSTTGVYTRGLGFNVFVENGNTYVSGVMAFPSANGGTSEAVYWKNNNITILTSYNLTGNANAGAYAQDLYVKDNNIHIITDATPPTTSNGGIRESLYFKNNIQIPLLGFNSSQKVYLSSIYVK
jgi:hypothetical protein